MNTITKVVYVAVLIGIVSCARAPESNVPMQPQLPSAQLIGSTPDGARIYVFVDREFQQVCHIVNRRQTTSVSCSYYGTQP